MNLKTLLATAAITTAAVAASCQPAVAATPLVQTTADVWAHSTPSTSTASRVYLVAGGAYVEVECYRAGPAVGSTNDTIWYNVFQRDVFDGYVAGYYLTTGHDPKPGVGRC